MFDSEVMLSVLFDVCMCVYIFILLFYLFCVHTHMSAYMCVGTSIVVRGQLVEVTFLPSTVWVLGMELRFPHLSSGAVIS